MTPLFQASFARWAHRIRTAIALRTTLASASAGAVVAVPFATVSWAGRHTHLLTAAIALPLGAGLVGAAVAYRTRWSDASIALLLDARLGTREAIATALELREAPPVGSAAALVLARAQDALDQATTAVVPRVLRRAHLALVASVVCLAGLAAHPRSVAPVTPVTVGAQAPLLTLERVPGLERVERLRALRASDRAQRQRLDALAAQAQRLREQLHVGMAPQQAQEALRQLRRAIDAERDRLADPSEQRGLEQAARTLEQAGFPEAAEALRSHDLTALDQAMEQAANSREASDRQRARLSLQDAAREAAQAGAASTANAMHEEEQLLRRRETRSSLLRQFAQQLAQDPSVRRAAEHLDRAGTDSAAQQLARTLEQALSRLSAEERTRLAQRMQEALRAAQQASQAGEMTPQQGQQGQQGAQGQQGGSQPMTEAEMERALREMANSDGQQSSQGGPQGGQQGEAGESGGGIPFPMLMPGGTPGAGAQQGLQQAGDGARQAQRQASDASGQGNGQGGQNGQGGNGNGQDGNESGDPGGTSRGGGPGQHGGRTGAAAGDDFRARVRGNLRGGSSAPGTLAGTTTGQPGATARTGHTGDLRAVGPDEIRGVDRSDIPTEYRDQVRVYFQP